jgi:hypothetical protein
MSVENTPLADGPMPEGVAPGFRLARGVCRFLVSCGFSPVTEFSPTRGLRTDVFALGPKGEVWIVECKSSLTDFRADQKWTYYLDWCDAYFFAVDGAFPQEVLPDEEGVIVADEYFADILRDPAPRKLAGARRKALTLKFARHAALRLRGATDPGVAGVIRDL